MSFFGLRVEDLKGERWLGGEERGFRGRRGLRRGKRVWGLGGGPVSRDAGFMVQGFGARL